MLYIYCNRNNLRKVQDYLQGNNEKLDLLGSDKVLFGITLESIKMFECLLDYFEEKYLKNKDPNTYEYKYIKYQLREILEEKINESASLEIKRVVKKYLADFGDHNETNTDITNVSRQAMEFKKIGDDYVQIKNYNLAREYYEKAIELHKTYVVGYCCFGDVLFKEGKVFLKANQIDKFIKKCEEAIEKYKKAISIDSEYWLGYRNLGEVYSKLWEYSNKKNNENYYINTVKNYCKSVLTQKEPYKIGFEVLLNFITKTGNENELYKCKKIFETVCESNKDKFILKVIQEKASYYRKDKKNVLEEIIKDIHDYNNNNIDDYQKLTERNLEKFNELYEYTAILDYYKKEHSIQEQELYDCPIKDSFIIISYLDDSNNTFYKWQIHEILTNYFTTASFVSQITENDVSISGDSLTNDNNE